ncbi:hypothetical protein [Neptunitalea lumnitzerae]|uniref:DUF3108 domain-containing protein n=1 Tax=Neptunitalea lumnitzerae TaxID=2965509 RepID=A0ABQ5MFQ7_9FLAO|nr:hypothetical protein [Neptunitalea sp. Y10]GLB48219.1 hypothetical protein Y10_05870 [Neptunitalea sp. Y10]
MKRVLYISILGLFLTPSAWAQKVTDTTYFEGTITYDITYISSKKGIDKNRLMALEGNKMVMTFKNGNYKKEFFAPDKSWLRSYYLLVENKKTYAKVADTDTVYWYSMAQRTSDAFITKGKDSVILNHKVVGFNSNIKVTLKTQPDSVFYVTSSYYFAPDLKVNPDWYEGFTEYRFDELFRRGKGIQLFMIEEGLYWTKIYTPTAINRRPVKDSELTLNLPEGTVFLEL